MSSPRRSPPLKPVSPPLSSTPLPRLIYILITLSILLISYYVYRGLQYTSAVGGWWNMALGRIPIAKSGPEKLENELPRGFSSAGCGSGGDESVEDRINGLARALGIPSKELASAIAGAVREYVPPASLSSVAAKESGKVVDILLKNENQKEETPGVVAQVVNSFAPLEDELE